MSDPAAWPAIKPGWTVLAADGSKVGEIDEVVGDEGSDIFDGISIATSAMGQPRYVPAEQVAHIEQGTVRLSLDAEQAARLEQYLQPATSVSIEPDDHHGLAEKIKANVLQAESNLVEPTQRHEHPLSFWARISHLLHRTRGR
jgi:hypothetical protein